jgi:hypothetical protein
MTHLLWMAVKNSFEGNFDNCISVTNDFLGVDMSHLDYFEKSHHVLAQ